MMRKLALCVVCLVVFFPRAVPALELGAIEAQSALHEPLNARIPLHDVQADDVEGMEVALGTPAQFEIAGMERPHHLTLIEFTVAEEDDGNVYIYLRTPDPIVKPLLTFLINVDWPHGHAMRGYNLYLIPPIRGVADASAIPRLVSKVERDPEAGAPAPDSSPPAAERKADAATPQPASSRTTDGTTYGPVRAQDTLWTLAARLRPDDSISIQRMMLALIEANPEAFTLGNVNGLNAGVILRIPTRGEIGPDDMAAAIAEVRRQHTAWKRYGEERRGTLAGAAPAPISVASPRTALAPAPSSPDTETTPSGRLEVVSPGTRLGADALEDDVDIRALRNKLALAIGEADAKHLENEEITARLTASEQQVEDLRLLVELKDDRIAALQAKLRELSEADAAPAPAPPETDAAPAPAPSATETALERAETGTVSTLAAPKSMIDTALEMLPFNRDIPAVNPVFLVGGAGLLLLLFGAAALFQRRRASAREGDAVDSMAESNSGERGFRIGDETEAAEVPSHAEGERSSRPASDAGPMDDVEEIRAPRSGLDGPALERAVEPSNAFGTGRPIFARTETGAGAGDDSSGLIIDYSDDPTGEGTLRAAPDTVGEAWDDETSEEYDFDVRGLAGAAAGADTESIEPAGEEASVPGLGRFGDRGIDFQAPTDKAAAGARSTPGRAKLNAARIFTPGADRSVAIGPDPIDGDSAESVSTPYILLDEDSPDGGGAALPASDGAGVVQTKIDIAQVYMEMGDAENARLFIDEVLAEGNAEQREIGLTMLSKFA